MEAFPKPRRAPVAWRAVDGVVLLDKPQGLSSNAALQRARRALRAAKGGHAGTLDPLATGMLPLCFGQATKACAALLGGRKAYRVALRLGAQTDTGDSEGSPIATAPVPEVTPAAAHAALAALLGPQSQVPPMYSALKHQGQPLYRLARAGQSVERPARTIEVYSAVLEALGDDNVEFTVECSSGTYVRVLGEDLAGRLGTLGHLVGLRRLWVEPFVDRPMVGLDEVEAWTVDQMPPWCQPADAALQHLPAISLDRDAMEHLLHGRQARVGPGEAQLLRAYGPDGRFLGLADRSEEGGLRVRRLFVEPGGTSSTQTDLSSDPARM